MYKDTKDTKGKYTFAIIIRKTDFHQCVNSTCVAAYVNTRLST